MADAKKGRAGLEEFKEWVKSHPEFWKQVEAAKAADARGETFISAKEFHEELRRRDEERRREEERRQNTHTDTRPST